MDPDGGALDGVLEATGCVLAGVEVLLLLLILEAAGRVDGKGEEAEILVFGRGER